MSVFGEFYGSTSFGSVDGQSFPPEYRCWEIEGMRGEYRQWEVDDTPPNPPHAVRMRTGTGGWGTTHWMRLEGHHFVECECIRGIPGEEPDKCKTVPCHWSEYIPIIGDPGSGAQCPRTTITSETDSKGNKRYYFERITKCTPKQTCGPQTWTYSTGSVDHNCDDYAKCCFAGTIRVDKDTMFSSEPCYDEGSILSPIIHSGWCGTYINRWLNTHPINPRCDMDVNCSDPNSEPNENEDIKCEFEFYEGHPND